MVAGIERQVVEIAETKVAMYDAYASEMDEMTRDEAYLQQHRRSFGSRPIRGHQRQSRRRPSGEEASRHAGTREV
jgi:hypothetical protein